MVSDAVQFVRNLCECDYETALKYVKLNIKGEFNLEKARWIENQRIEADRKAAEDAAYEKLVDEERKKRLAERDKLVDNA